MFVVHNPEKIKMDLINFLEGSSDNIEEIGFSLG